MATTEGQRIWLRTEVVLIISMILIAIAGPSIQLLFAVSDMIRLSYYPKLPIMMQMIGFNMATLAAIVRLVQIKRNKTSIIVLNIILTGVALTTAGWLWDNWGKFKYTTAELIVHILYVAVPILLAVFTTKNIYEGIEKKKG